MITGLQVVAAARSFVGVPFVHMGRSSRGCDCIGLVIAVADQLGLRRPEKLVYKELPDLLLFDAMRQYADMVDDPSPGDLVRFTVAGRPQHVGILSNHPSGTFGVIHAYMTATRVCEHVLDLKWRRRIQSFWRIKGVC